MSRRKSTSTVVVLPHLLALVVSIACWSVTALAQEQPLYGGTMVLATFADPGSLNPGLTHLGTYASGHRADV
jgi:ABC-type transport system substrate-binding protein